MTSNKDSAAEDRSSGPRSDATPDSTPDLAEMIDPGTTDLGDDAYRTATNRGSALDHDTGREAGFDAGTTDLGDDAYRTPTNRGSALDHDTGADG